MFGLRLVFGRIRVPVRVGDRAEDRVRVRVRVMCVSTIGVDDI